MEQIQFIDQISDLFPALTYRQDDEILKTYTVDGAPEALGEAPFVVVFPQTNEEVQGVLRCGYACGVPMVVRGAGTGTVGGACSVGGGLVISLEKLDGILEIDEANGMVVCQPGVITGDLQAAVKEKGLFYPPDPASIGVSTIGGNVATNAGGPHCYKYGVTGHYVLGLKGYYPDGTPFSFGGKHLKNVAGYNMVQLMVGSEGTLGVITEITLRLIPQPLYSKDLLVTCQNWEEAFAFQSLCLKEGIQPATLEFFEDVCVQAVAAYRGESLSWPEGLVYILVSLHHDDSDALSKIIKKLETFNGALNISTSPEASEALWQVRRDISPALKLWGNGKISEDIVVPPSSIPQFMSELKNLSELFATTILGYGHLGDGNVHVNVLKGNHSGEDWQKKKTEIVTAVFKLAVNLGGTITGEHGIGLTKKSFLPMVFSEQDMGVMKAIKEAFDPKNLLNPGKLI